MIDLSHYELKSQKEQKKYKIIKIDYLDKHLKKGEETKNNIEVEENQKQNKRDKEI